MCLHGVRASLLAAGRPGWVVSLAPAPSDVTAQRYMRSLFRAQRDVRANLAYQAGRC